MDAVQGQKHQMLKTPCSFNPLLGRVFPLPPCHFLRQHIPTHPQQSATPHFPLLHPSTLVVAWTTESLQELRKEGPKAGQLFHSPSSVKIGAKSCYGQQGCTQVVLGGQKILSAGSSGSEHSVNSCHNRLCVLECQVIISETDITFELVSHLAWYP